MNELRQHIEQAFQMISAFAVKGDGVDLIASVRDHLRKAYALAGEKEADEQPDKAAADATGEKKAG